MQRYLFTLLLALSMSAIARASDADEASVVIYEVGNVVWSASHLAGGEYMDDRRRWVAARVRYATSGTPLSSTFAIRGCDSKRGDGLAWLVEKSSLSEHAMTTTPEVRFSWSDGDRDSNFSIIAARLCQLAEADGWFGR
jgi:hypothetical protein